MAWGRTGFNQSAGVPPLLPRVVRDYVAKNFVKLDSADRLEAELASPTRMVHGQTRNACVFFLTSPWHVASRANPLLTQHDVTIAADQKLRVWSCALRCSFFQCSELKQSEL